MPNLRQHAAIITLLLTLPFILKVSAQPPATETAPNRIAVINLVKVFSLLDEKNAGDREIEALGKQITLDRRKKEDNIKALAEALNMSPFRPGSPDYKKQRDESLQAAADLQVFLLVSEQRLRLLQLEKTQNIYRAMNLAIKKYAETHNIALVFAADDADLSAAKDVNELTSHIATRKVLYAHPSFDISKEVVEQMNADFNHP